MAYWILVFIQCLVSGPQDAQGTYQMFAWSSPQVSPRGLSWEARAITHPWDDMATLPFPDGVATELTLHISAPHFPKLFFFFL